MFSLLNARLASRLVYSSTSSILARKSLAIPAIARVALSNQIRTFVSGTDHLRYPATSKSTSVERNNSTERTAIKKKSAARKSVKKPAKKTVAAKRKTAKKPSKKRAVGRKKPAKKPTGIKLTKEHKPPKRSPTGRGLFIQEYFSKHPRSTSVNTSQSYLKAASEEYTRMSDAEREPYRARARALHEQYKITYRKWYEKLSLSEIRAINKKRASKKKCKVHKPDGLPKRPPGAFFTFMNEIRDPNLNAIQNSQVATKAWKELSAAEREKRLADAAEEMSEWKRQRA